MQTANVRYLLICAVLLAGAGLYVTLGEPIGSGTPRWPSADALYAVDTWSVGPQKVEGDSTASITRQLRSASGTTASLVIFSNQAPKLYAAGAEVPFLGNGYSVEPAPPELVSIEAGTGVNGLLARQGNEQWLVMYAYGERRGLLGNGPSAWSLALLDGILGRPNDYYKLYLTARVDARDAGASKDVVRLAQTLFPRIAAFYAS